MKNITYLVVLSGLLGFSLNAGALPVDPIIINSVTLAEQYCPAPNQLQFEQKGITGKPVVLSSLKGVNFRSSPDQPIFKPTNIAGGYIVGANFYQFDGNYGIVQASGTFCYYSYPSVANQAVIELESAPNAS